MAGQPHYRKNMKQPQLPWNLIAKSEGVYSGAKKGGVTEHIPGPHLIPTCGREAMVPAEVVRRKPKARPKPKVEPPKPVPVFVEKKTKEPKKEKQRQRELSGSRSRSRKRHSRSPSRSGSRYNSRRSDSGRSRSKSSDIHPSKKVEPDEDIKLARDREEARRREEEERKVQELVEAKRKQQELAAARKKRLGGAFALDEDEIEGDTKQTERERTAAQLELSRRRPVMPLVDDGHSRYSSSSRSQALAVTAEKLMETGSSVTAADIDGSFHDHKFAKVWKDWDATKKDNPGEVAKQFMRIAAIKRRGQSTGQNREPGAGRDYSRSRSRSRRRR